MQAEYEIIEGGSWIEWVILLGKCGKIGKMYAELFTRWKGENRHSVSEAIQKNILISWFDK